jgi:hypothetical protein
MRLFLPLGMALLPAGILAAAALAPRAEMPVAAVLPFWWTEERRLAAAAAADAPILALGRLGVVVLSPGARAPHALLHLNARPAGLCLTSWTRT